MFSVEEHGYKKIEVDNYISKLKSELLEKKLSLLNSEQKVLDLTQKKNEIYQKEKSILKAVKVLEEANKIQEEGSKNLSSLKNKRSLILCEKVEELIEYLDSRYPQMASDKKVATLIQELNDLMDKTRRSEEVTSESDSMRALLNKMQEYKKQKEQEDIKVVKIERNSKIKPICNNTNIDEFLSSKPDNDKLYENIEIESNSFDLKEAVNPKDDLDIIMKAFDFFNNEE